MSDEARVALAFVVIYWVFLMPLAINGMIRMNELLRRTKTRHEDE